MRRDGPISRPGWRRLIFSVDNQSAAPAVVVVAEDTTGARTILGTADPGEVPPGATVDVTVRLPPKPDWGSFINPRPNRGPVIAVTDVPPDASGRAPISLGVDASGETFARSRGPTPGWLGNL